MIHSVTITNELCIMLFWVSFQYDNAFIWGLMDLYEIHLEQPYSIHLTQRKIRLSSFEYLPYKLLYAHEAR